MTEVPPWPKQYDRCCRRGQVECRGMSVAVSGSTPSHLRVSAARSDAVASNVGGGVGYHVCPIRQPSVRVCSFTFSLQLIFQLTKTSWTQRAQNEMLQAGTSRVSRYECSSERKHSESSPSFCCSIRRRCLQCRWRSWLSRLPNKATFSSAGTKRCTGQSLSTSTRLSLCLRIVHATAAITYVSL
ncbi:hypothetical protein BC835DRAFT_201408 [Cytidiella melzeri]|nr:hypothetical protein BC835DRAFT_201408 [Cytidiella melzeri]